MSDLDAGFKRFFEVCAQTDQANCAWKEPDGQLRTFDNLLTKFNNWVGANPQATDGNRGRVDSPLTATGGTAQENSDLTNQRSYIIRSLFRTVLRDPSGFRKLAQILEYWYENPAEIQDINFKNYQVPNTSNKRDTTNSDFLFDSTTGYNYDPNTAAAAEKATSNELEGITCSENTYRNRNPQVSDYRLILNKYLETSVYAGDAGTGIIFACYPWITTSDAPNPGRFANIQTSNPILFVQTLYDPVTPSKSGKAARDAFTSASIIYSTGFGVSVDAQTTIEVY